MPKYWFSAKQKEVSARLDLLKEPPRPSVLTEVITKDFRILEYTEISDSKPNFEDAVLVADIEGSYFDRILVNKIPQNDLTERLLLQMKTVNKIRRFAK